MTLLKTYLDLKKLKRLKEKKMAKKWEQLQASTEQETVAKV